MVLSVKSCYFEYERNYASDKNAHVYSLASGRQLLYNGNTRCFHYTDAICPLGNCKYAVDRRNRHAISHKIGCVPFHFELTTLKNCALVSIIVHFPRQRRSFRLSPKGRSSKMDVSMYLNCLSWKRTGSNRLFFYFPSRL